MPIVHPHHTNGTPQVLDQYGRPFPRDPHGNLIPSGDSQPGGLALPPGYQFVARVGGGNFTFWHDRWDEAMAKARTDAVDMLNDPWLRALLQERMLAASSLKYHFGVPDEKDPWQLHVKDSMARQVKAIKQMVRIIPWHYEAIWFGRQGVQFEWEPTVVRDDFDPGNGLDKPDEEPARPSDGMPTKALAMMRRDPALRYLRDAMMQDPTDKVAHAAYGDRLEEMGMRRPGADVGTNFKTRRSLNVAQAWPVQGDKIGHQFDHTPYVLINSAEEGRLRELDPHVSIVHTTVGTGLSLRGTWRKRFVIHQQYQEDRDYFLGPEEAEAMHGVGLRSWAYWGNWLKLEAMAKITDFYDRLGLGTTIWKYESGNQEALAVCKKASQDQSNRSHIFVPVIPGQEQSTAVERLEVPSSGASEVMKLVEYYDKQLERLFVGQEGSASATSASGHSNKSSSEFQESTKLKITRQDALWHALSMTGTKHEPGMLSIMQEYSFPETVKDFPVSWEYDFDTKESQEKLQAAKMVVDMGIDKVKVDDVLAAAGLSKAADGDETVKPPSAGGPPAPGGPGGGDPLAALMGGGRGAPPNAAPGEQDAAPGSDQAQEQPAEQGDFLDALRAMREAADAIRYAHQPTALDPPDSGAVVHNPPFVPVSLRHARLARVVNRLRRAGKDELAEQVVRRFNEKETISGNV
jgi:hypothetical protein